MKFSWNPFYLKYWFLITSIMSVNIPILNFAIMLVNACGILYVLF